MSDRHLDDKLQQLESALSQLTPAADLNRNGLLFRAGRASVWRRFWLTASVTGLAGILTGFLPAFLVLQLNQQTSPRIVYVPVAEVITPHRRPAAPSPPQPEPKRQNTKPPSAAGQKEQFTGISDWTPMSTTSYIGMRNQALRWGVGVLPSSQTNFTDAPASRLTLSEMYPRIRGLR